MPSDPVTLAFDTSAAHCAAVLLRGEAVLAERVEEMGRGQAERLMPLLDEVLAEAGLDWSALDRIGVGVGPGNFTGIRIAVSAARGLALALGVPAVGVSSLAVQQGPVLATVPAPRDQVYAQLPDGAPELMPRTEAEALAATHGLALAEIPEPAALVLAIAQLAQRAEPGLPPAPLYVRAADAAPPRDPAPVILP